MNTELKRKLRQNPYDARWRIAGLVSEAIEGPGRARDLILYSRHFEDIVSACGLCPLTVRLMVQVMAKRDEVVRLRLAA